MFKNRYRYIKEIGCGTSGRALLVQDIKGSNNVVLKEIPLNRDEIDTKNNSIIREEVEILSKLSHPNIINCFGSFEEKGNLYIITEYASQGDLHQLLKRLKTSPSHAQLTEDQILKFSSQLVNALAYLHDKKILHRDIKSRNVFLFPGIDIKEEKEVADNFSNNYILKLGDFGISRSLADTAELAHTAIGTPYYLSPEICESKPYDYKSDIWSLGCVIYEVCTLKHAFDSRHIRGLVLNIIKAEYSPIPRYCIHPATNLIDRHFSHELSFLISSLLQKDPSLRPSAKELLKVPCISKNIYTAHKQLPVIPSITSSNLLPLNDPDINLSSLTKKFKSLLEIFNDRNKAFDLLCQYLFGNITRETIMICYKWTDRDTLEDIIQHIEWSHDKRQFQENNLSFNPHIEENHSNMPLIKIKPKEINGIVQVAATSANFTYSRISPNEYVLNGRLFSLGSFGTLGSKILCSWIQGPNYSFEDTPSSEDISSVIGMQKQSSSLMLKLEIIKDFLTKELGKATFMKIYHHLRDMVDLSIDECQKGANTKTMKGDDLNLIFGGFIFSLLMENNFLSLLVHLIINEKMAKWTMDIK